MKKDPVEDEILRYCSTSFNTPGILNKFRLPLPLVSAEKKILTASSFSAEKRILLLLFIEEKIMLAAYRTLWMGNGA